MSSTEGRTGHEVQAEAFRMFDRWRAEHDVDGELEILDAAMVYYAWSMKNDMTKYTDAAALASQVQR